MNEDEELLQRYVDGDLSPSEAEELRARLTESPELQRELVEIQTVGALVRAWGARSESRADDLLAPTLARIREADEQRARRTSLGFVLAALLLFTSPWANDVRAPLRAGLFTPPPSRSGAAIERLQAGRTHARVFVVGHAGTPVVWLADEVIDDDREQQDPG